MSSYVLARIRQIERELGVLKAHVRVCVGGGADLETGLCPWAKYCTGKGAVKLHVLLDNNRHIPRVFLVTEGKKGDIRAAKSLSFEKNLPRLCYFFK